MLCREYVNDQFTKYVNRYGPGMVIYWFGFVDELQNGNSNLVLVDGFPAAADIVQLPCIQVSDDILTSELVPSADSSLSMLKV